MAHNLKLIFLKNNNGANDFLLKIYLHFTQKYYTVRELILPYVLTLVQIVRFHFQNKIDPFWNSGIPYYIETVKYSNNKTHLVGFEKIVVYDCVWYGHIYIVSKVSRNFQ